MDFIDYNTWQETCKMITKIKKNRLKMYMQWYPFSILSYKDKQKLISEEFYNIFIKAEGWVYIDEIWHVCNHYFPKEDLSFRNAFLISPILYLIIQAFGKLVHDNVFLDSREKITTFYAGDFNNGDAYYKKPYDRFVKKINIEKEEYKFFIKVDIQNFFDNISLDALFKKIENSVDLNNAEFNNNNMYIMKRLFSYIGYGKYPVIENSPASSYLASVLYLNDTEIDFYDKINHLNIFENFEIIRYVDDTYILFNIKDEAKLNDRFNEVMMIYSTLLRKIGLSLNARKCVVKRTEKINEILKQSLYDEMVNDVRFNLDDLIKNDINVFLEQIYDLKKNDLLTIIKYNEVVEECFYEEGILLQPQEILNSLSINSKGFTSSTTKLLNSILACGLSVIRCDPKRLTRIILNTRDEKLIKKLLSRLFETSRNRQWTSYDMLIMLQYFIQRSFKHRDLLALLEKEDQFLYQYYKLFCKNSFINILSKYECDIFFKIANGDIKLAFMYCLFRCEWKAQNKLSAYAYFKNYFDRITALIDYYERRNKREKIKKPNYKGFYKEGHFKTFFKNINNCDLIIKEAHEIRNSNPISHSSAELMDKLTLASDIKKSIDDLKGLINQYIDSINI